MARLREGDEFKTSEAFLEVQGALGRKIRRLRDERQVSQRQLASIADISGPHMGLIEMGKGNVSLLALVKIAKALGVAVSDLFEGAGPTQTGTDSAIVRLAATVGKVEQHLASRRDDFARFGDELKDFMKDYWEGKERGKER